MGKLRKCMVKDRVAYFHRWSDKSSIVPPSLMVGGDQGGVLKLTVGIIEYVDDGVVTECYPYEIRFLEKPSGDTDLIKIYYGDGFVEEISKDDIIKRLGDLKEDLQNMY